VVRKPTEAGYGRYLVRGLHTHQASGKIEWDANEETVVLKFTVRTQMNLGLAR